MKPFRTPLFLFGLPAVVVAFASSRAGLLLFDRTALAQGELWRAWTAHWVHFSASHLLWNLAAIIPAGAWLEHRHPGWLLRHTLLATPLVSLLLYFAEPAMQRYGGLSALATSIVTLAALTLVFSARPDRMAGVMLLLLVTGKIAYDLTHATALFSRFDAPLVRPSVFAHAAGAAVALSLWPLWTHGIPAARTVARRVKITPPGPVTDSRRQGSGHHP
jgi:rhomboid family GlyGly-CTERM serine protease